MPLFGHLISTRGDNRRKESLNLLKDEKVILGSTELRRFWTGVQFRNKWMWGFTRYHQEQLSLPLSLTSACLSWLHAWASLLLAQTELRTYEPKFSAPEWIWQVHGQPRACHSSNWSPCLRDGVRWVRQAHLVTISTCIIWNRGMIVPKRKRCWTEAKQEGTGKKHVL